MQYLWKWSKLEELIYILGYSLAFHAVDFLCQHMYWRARTTRVIRSSCDSSVLFPDAKISQFALNNLNDRLGNISIVCQWHLCAQYLMFGQLGSEKYILHKKELKNWKCSQIHSWFTVGKSLLYFNVVHDMFLICLWYMRSSTSKTNNNKPTFFHPFSFSNLSTPNRLTRMC